jgi:hypothetical protein
MRITKKAGHFMKSSKIYLIAVAVVFLLAANGWRKTTIQQKRVTAI